MTNFGAIALRLTAFVTLLGVGVCDLSISHFACNDSWNPAVECNSVIAINTLCKLHLQLTTLDGGDSVNGTANSSRGNGGIRPSKASLHLLVTSGTETLRVSSTLGVDYWIVGNKDVTLNGNVTNEIPLGEVSITLPNFCGQTYLIARITETDRPGKSVELSTPIQLICPEKRVDLALIGETQEEYDMYSQRPVIHSTGQSLTYSIPNFKLSVKNVLENSSYSARTGPSVYTVSAYLKPMMWYMYQWSIGNNSHQTAALGDLALLNYQLGDVMLHKGNGLVSTNGGRSTPTLSGGYQTKLLTENLILGSKEVCGNGIMVVQLSVPYQPGDSNITNNFYILPVFVDCWGHNPVQQIETCQVIPNYYDGGQTSWITYTVPGQTKVYEYKSEERSVRALNPDNDGPIMRDVALMKLTTEIHSGRLMELGQCVDTIWGISDSFVTSADVLLTSVRKHWDEVRTTSDVQKQQHYKISLILSAVSDMLTLALQPKNPLHNWLHIPFQYFLNPLLPYDSRTTGKSYYEDTNRVSRQKREVHAFDLPDNYIDEDWRAAPAFGQSVTPVSVAQPNPTHVPSAASAGGSTASISTAGSRMPTSGSVSAPASGSSATTAKVGPTVVSMGQQQTMSSPATVTGSTTARAPAATVRDSAASAGRLTANSSMGERSSSVTSASRQSPSVTTAATSQTGNGSKRDVGAPQMVGTSGTTVTTTSGSIAKPTTAGTLNASTTASPAATGTTSRSASGTTSRSATGTTATSASGTMSRSASGTTSRSATGTTATSASGTMSRSASGTTSRSATGTAATSASGTTSRSASGTTSRSDSGTTARSASGTTSRSATSTTARPVSGTSAGSASGTTSRSASGTTSRSATGTTSRTASGTTSRSASGTTARSDSGTTVRSVTVTMPRSANSTTSRPASDTTTTTMLRSSVGPTARPATGTTNRAFSGTQTATYNQNVTFATTSGDRNPRGHVEATTGTFGGSTTTIRYSATSARQPTTAPVPSTSSDEQYFGIKPKWHEFVMEKLNEIVKYNGKGLYVLSPQRWQAISMFLKTLLYGHKEGFDLLSYIPKSTLDNLVDLLKMAIGQNLPRVFDDIPEPIVKAVMSWMMEKQRGGIELGDSACHYQEGFELALNVTEEILQQKQWAQRTDQLTLLAHMFRILLKDDHTEYLAELYTRFSAAQKMGRTWMIRDGIPIQEPNADDVCRRYTAVKLWQLQTYPVFQFAGRTVSPNQYQSVFWRQEQGTILRGDLSELTGQVFWSKVATCSCPAGSTCGSSQEDGNAVPTVESTSRMSSIGSAQPVTVPSMKLAALQGYHVEETMVDLTGDSADDSVDNGGDRHDNDAEFEETEEMMFGE